MRYDTSRRCFVFQNKAEAKLSAMLFYDLPHLLSLGEEICPEVSQFADRLPGIDGPFAGDLGRWLEGAYPHQPEPIRWLVGRKGTGILAYGMGLGKTFISIRAALALGRRRVLVVCQSHLKHNWANEIAMWSPELGTHICEGRNSALPMADCFTIINRDILADNLTELRKIGFDQIIVDECHKVGAWGTGAYEALDTLCKDVRAGGGGVLLMTGTLFKNSPMDAHSALHLLSPHLAGPRGTFQTRFDPIGHRKQEVMGLMRRKSAPRWLIRKKWAEIKELEKQHGKNGDVEGLRWLLAQYAIRKRYSDVFPDDLKTRKTDFVSVDLELTEGQRRILANRGVEEGGVIKGELATVLRIVAERKAPFVAEFAENWLEEREDKKLVVVTWHIAARDIIKAGLLRFGVVEIQGTPKQKQKAEAAFRDDPGVRVCLINVESGGTGLNLVSASDLIFSEVPWTSASYEQVKARIDRIGQESDTINYTVFIAADTPEGAKFGTLRKKAGLQDRYFS